MFQRMKYFYILSFRVGLLYCLALAFSLESENSIAFLYKFIKKWTVLITTMSDLRFGFNSLPNDKILNLPKLKAFTDEEINEA